MYCHNCGKENVENAKFCSGCGCPLEVPQEKVEKNEKGEKNEKKQNSRTLAMVTGVVVLIILLIMALFSPKKVQETLETSVIGLESNEETQVRQEVVEEKTILPFAANQPNEFSTGVSPASYILPESNSKTYSADELSLLSAEQLRLARNEIFARHGRKFTSEDLQSYFSAQPWYIPKYGGAEFDALGDGIFNAFEIENRKLIMSLENGGVSVRKTAGNVTTVSDNISGEYYYYRAYIDEEITREMTPQTTTNWMTVAKNSEGLLVHFTNDWVESRQYTKVGKNEYVFSQIFEDGYEYRFPMTFNDDGTVEVYNYDGMEWSMYKKK